MELYSVYYNICVEVTVAFIKKVVNTLLVFQLMILQDYVHDLQLEGGVSLTTRLFVALLCT